MLDNRLLLEGFIAKYGEDFTKVDAMVILCGVMLVNGGIDEISGVEIIPVDFPTFQNQGCLGVAGRRNDGGSDRGEPRCEDFIPIATRAVTEEAEGGMVLLREGADGEGVILFHEFVGVAGRADDDLDKGAASDVPDTAPANGHGIVMAGRGFHEGFASNQYPFALSIAQRHPADIRFVAVFLGHDVWDKLIFDS